MNLIFFHQALIELVALGEMTKGEKIVACVFMFAALGWIFREFFTGITGLMINDTIIALVAALILFTIPISSSKGEFALDWEATRNLPWGILILFGGGLALADGFQNTGLAEWIGATVSGIEASTLALILLVIITIIYLTEITSNTASTATFLPILAAVAIGLELNPVVLCVPAALGASMAFMMPVATPPNAIVFSYKGLTLGDMVRAGFLLNLLAIAVSFTLFSMLADLVFNVAL